MDATARQPDLLPRAEQTRLIRAMENQLWIRARLAGRDPAEVISEFDAAYDLCLRCGCWRKRRPA